MYTFRSSRLAPIDRLSQLGGKEFDQLADMVWKGFGVSADSELKIIGPHREGDTVVVKVEVPGIDPDSISVSLQGKGIQVETPDKSAYVTLGERLDTEGATANIKWGLLTISVPTRESRLTKIKINSEE
jgi:HSP20 family molecular chaperone IbpA